MRTLALTLSLLLTSSTLVNSATASDLIDHGRFDRYNDAMQTAENLRAEGRQITVFREPVTRDGFAVQLPYYQLYIAAEWAATRLQREGFQAWVIPKPESLGYVIQVDIVPSREEVADVRQRLDMLGHRNIRVRPIRWKSYQYFVQETRLEGMTEAIVEAPDAPKPTPDEPEVESFSFGDDSVLTFGKQTDYDTLLVQQDKDPSLRNQGFEVDDFRAEFGFLDAKTGGLVESSHYGLISMGYRFVSESGFDGRIGLRVDAVRQAPERTVREAEVDYGESFLRYRAGDHKYTVGAQVINWGVLDELAPGNVLATQDLTRYTLDDLTRRYRATPLLRYEGWFDRWKVDVIGLPLFRAAELPEPDSIWFPIDSVTGRIIGLPNDPLLAALVQNSTFETNIEDDHGGGGLRVSHQGRGWDFGFSVQHVRHSLPYFELNSDVRLALLTGTPPNIAPTVSTEPTFQAIHPFTDVVSLDFATVWGDTTWRAEMAYLSDVPVTTPDLRVVYAPSAQIGFGMEMFPGDANNRLSMQVGFTHLEPDEPILDREQTAYISGEFEWLFAREAWRLRTRFLSTWSEEGTDYYLNPELAYIRVEPDEFYIGVHIFEGDEGTPGDYHNEHDMFVLGWRTRY